MYSQDKSRIAVSTGFLQIKDDFNQGMVYNGPMVNVQYQGLWDFSIFELSYKPKIALGVPFNRGMLAVNINFVPVDLTGLKAVYNSERHLIKIGLNFATNYSYQSYPDFQNAHLFWFGEIGFSPVLEYEYKCSTRSIGINLQNSLFGFVSRTKDYNPYFYSFAISDFATSPHKNMQFGGFDKYNHTNLQIEFRPNALKASRFIFGFEYINAHFNTYFQSLNYYLQWKKTF
jgi:hypothetical protein